MIKPPTLYRKIVIVSYMTACLICGYLLLLGYDLSNLGYVVSAYLLSQKTLEIIGEIDLWSEEDPFKKDKL